MKKNKKVGFFTRSHADMQYYIIQSKYLRCDDCDMRLGFWHSARQALFKKIGDHYFIECKICGCINKRVKGDLKKEFDKRWENLD